MDTIVSQPERIALLQRQIADLQRLLKHLDGQLREARMRTPRLLAKAHPAGQDRVRKELRAVEAEMARLIELEAKLEAELFSLTSAAE
jgi:hypothetical protein